MPRPAALEPDVEFWTHVYTQVDTNSGYLHDQYNLGVVYETVRFAPDSSQSAREREVDARRERIAAALRRIAAAGDSPLSPEDQRIRDLWGPGVSPARLREAVDDIRFQLGQADRFRAGLIRSGAWETHIAEALANRGLPAELAVLPHVESSFNPAAYSKVGAAGLWQFMRSTGRRYMRIDSSVDDRLDPFRSTEAAAQLLAYNYRVLGTWPLALTAWNHGTAGMLRAKESLGTDDIVTILRRYNGRTFGFASRNFYVSFLAALDIDHNPDKYFGAVQRQGEARFQVVTVPGYVSMATLERVLSVPGAELRALNPALLRPVWDGQLRVPRDYHLRLPFADEQWTTDLLAHQLNPRELYAGQPQPKRYKVQQGDTLAKLADRYGVPIDTLARMNRIRVSAALKVGRTINLPEGATVQVASSSVPAPAAGAGQAGGVSAAVAQRESAEDAAALATITVFASREQPVSAAQAEALSPALGPAAEPQQGADPTDYTVAGDDSIRVAAEETLGHYADWLGLSAQHLRDLNHMSMRKPVLVGHRLKLDFHKVPHDAFEQKRRDYHQQLQAAYFAEHRISGTEIYIARAGDSLWTVTRRAPQLPEWLLVQYNPDVDFSELKPGTQIVVPRVEDVANSG
ncbi:MAG TPA: transglycosylase SLT domain-containing protein [Steroidobacteraceae bacterium]|nr:transglycosylase SLT domain-containing protein [Steroidobacteraceae bacterium]